MEASPSRLGLRLVAASYAVIGVVSALLIFRRYLQYVGHPEDAAAYGGMWAGGDLMLELFILLLLLMPTAALVLIIRKCESAYTNYAKALLGLSVTAPASLGLMFIPIFNQWYLGDALIFRVFAIPIVFFVMMISRWLTRFARPRRLISYAVAIEGLTFVCIVGGIFLLGRFGA